MNDKLIEKVALFESVKRTIDESNVELCNLVYYIEKELDIIGMNDNYEELIPVSDELVEDIDKLIMSM